MKQRLAIFTSVVSALAVAVWLGGLAVLGAIVAPTVFAIVPMPHSADAMTVVFRRFDTVAMSCAALALAAEALRVALRVPFTRVDVVRGVTTVFAAAVTTYEGANVSPQIAALHASGAIRGVGAAGIELGRLHDVAEACGKVSLALLIAVVALQVLSKRPAGPTG